jgi:enoyl-CoA hydratase/carnithine racemase
MLRGAGGHFVAGTDIAQFETFTSGDDGVAYERLIEAVLSRLETTRIPTLAVVEGHAAGAGLLIAAACDLRICTPEARFSAPVARTVGNTLSLANHARLLAHFGVSRTKALLMTAGSLEAAQALAAGFVHEVVEHADVDARAHDLAATIASLAPMTLRATKRLVARILAVTMSADDIVREVYGSRDFHEGVNAFRQKRPPSWEGR